jgi:hypothetical protein
MQEVQMGEMVERVTKAIHEAMDVTDGLDVAAAERYARAAIEAMREPNDLMCEAGYSAGTGDWGGRYDNRRELARGRIQPGWSAMIDAALK